MSKVASYKHGVSWIAMNDNNGALDAMVTEVVASYISTILLADLFGKTVEHVAKDIVKARMRIEESTI